MLHNYTGTEPIISGSKNGTLDLCGNTYTHTGGNDCIIQVNNNNVSLTVKNGIILSQKLGTDGVQMLGYKSMDTYVPARNRAVTLENVNLTVVGDAYGIITNGQDENERVVLKNSTLNVLDGYGIYFPSSGSVTIEDSVINAKYFGVQMCSGSLEVMGDKTAITTTGEPQKKTESDGPIADGAAISVVNRSYPGGTPTMNVTGGTFNSNHANAVKAYTFSNDNKTEENWENAKEFVSISGGKFSNPESIKDYLEPGCELEGGIVVPAKDSVAKIGNKGYMTLAEAVADAAVGDTITLLADITELSKLTNGATTGNNISLLSIDKDVTIAGNNKTISITMPKEATNRSQAIEIGKNAQVTLDGVTLNVKGSASETDRGDAIDVYGTLNITNKSAITIENVNNGFVMQGGEVAHVNVTGGSTVTIKNVAGNASNGGNFAVKENSVVNISGCQSNGLSVYTLTVDNSDVNISDTGLTAIYGNELKFNAGANVTVERAGTKIPATGWNGVQFNAPVQVKDGKGAQVSMSVASGATVTVKDCVGSDNKSHNTIYLPANTTYTDNGTVNAEIVTAKAPENSFVVTLVSDGKTVGVQTVAKGTAFALPKAPEKSNYTFNGWSDGSKTYKAGEKATIDKDTTFTAQWSYNGYTGPSGYAVKTEVGAHGKLTVSSSYATKGTTVTMTVTPDKGYVLSNLTVTDKNGNALTLTDKGNGKYTFVMPEGAVTVKAAFGPESLPFTDISVDAYYANAVKWAVDKGVTSGLTATTFGPNESCTRGQMVTFLWRAAGSPAPKTAENPFTDVAAGTYYYKAVLWAVENDITAGVTETTFGPEQTVTRGQVVAFLYRQAGSPAVGSKNPFTDVASNVYYANAVKWAVAQKITAGTTDTTFSPNADCTRGQIVTFLYNHMAK